MFYLFSFNHDCIQVMKYKSKGVTVFALSPYFNFSCMIDYDIVKELYWSLRIKKWLVILEPRALLTQQTSLGVLLDFKESEKKEKSEPRFVFRFWILS